MTRADNAFYVGPPQELEKYRLQSHVGSGGEATLWRAEMSVSGEWEPVAVKILNHDKQRHIEVWRSRWADQVELLRLIQHPGVVGIREHFQGPPMHRAGMADRQMPEQLYLVMNWIEGTTLAEWRALHHQPDAYFQGLRHLMQVADILASLHRGDATPSRREVIHADLTPANIIIDKGGQAVLVDFGMVRVARQTSRVAEGTRGYCAPEVLREGLYTCAADRYSFGALTFFTLTGEHPSENLADIKHRLSSLPIVAANPAHLDHLMRMFDPQPEARPLPNEWIRAFRQLSTTTSGSPDIGLPPPHPPVREARPRRGRLWTMGASLAAVALAVGGVLWLLPNQSAGGQQPQVVSSSGTPTATPAPSSARPSALIANPTEMPPVTGLSAEDTAEYLRGLNIKVSVVYEWDEKVEEDVITRQLPKAGSKLPPVVRLVAARRPAVNYLSALSPISGTSPEYTRAYIGGRTFPQSAVFYECTQVFSWTDKSDWENVAVYDLGQAYTEFRATIGIGQVGKDVSGKFQVLVDGVPGKASVVNYGESVEIAVSLKDAQRLTIRSDCNDSNDEAPQLWGDARLYKEP